METPPSDWAWDPRANLPEGTDPTNWNGVQYAWAALMFVFTRVLPTAWGLIREMLDDTGGTLV